MTTGGRIRTPDQRLRVFVSSTLGELAGERAAVRGAIENLRLTPVMFELGARPHPPRELYRSYLVQSDVFLGIYWQRYGWVAPEEKVSGLEDEYRLSSGMPQLLYVKAAGERDPRLTALLAEVQRVDTASYRHFTTAEELADLVRDDLAVLLTERFAQTVDVGRAPEQPTPARDPRSTEVAPASGLIGRDGLLDSVLTALADPYCRLLTLTGPGGIGKSRLALEVVHRLQARVPDGVWTVRLDSVRDPALVPSAISQALGIRESAGAAPIDGLLAYLRDREALLVLDNLEQLAGSVQLISALRAGCPRLKVLATSRARLRLRGERELPVGPLALPVDGQGGAAVELFAERARNADPEFDLDTHADAVAEICRRLDGVPLALELAAARTRLLTPEQLLDRLDRRLGLLTGGSVDMPARHRTMRAAIDWGHDLLSPDEQAALRRLAVFEDGFTLNAVGAVLSASAAVGTDGLDLLESLLEQSFLVRRSDRTDARLVMLQTIREYALERLAGSGEETAVRNAHARWCLALAESSLRTTRPSDDDAWLDALDREHANLRAALRWLQEQDDVEAQLRLAIALGHFWRLRAHFTEGRRALESAEQRSRGRRDLLRLRVLNRLAYLARAQGDWARIEGVLTEALALAEELGDLLELHDSTIQRGNLAHDTGRGPEACRWWQRSLEIAERTGDERAISRSLNNLGVAARLAGDLDAAEEFLARNQGILERMGSAESIARLLLNQTDVALDRGDAARAMQLGREAVRRFAELRDAWDLVDALENLGSARALAGDGRKAAVLLGAGESLREAIQASRAGAEAANFDGRVQFARAALDDDAAFDRAWAQGRALSMEQAVHAALSEP